MSIVSKVRTVKRNHLTFLSSTRSRKEINFSAFLASSFAKFDSLVDKPKAGAFFNASKELLQSLGFNKLASLSLTQPQLEVFRAAIVWFGF